MDTQAIITVLVPDDPMQSLNTFVRVESLKGMCLSFCRIEEIHLKIGFKGHYSGMTDMGTLIDN